MTAEQMRALPVVIAEKRSSRRAGSGGEDKLHCYRVSQCIILHHRSSLTVHCTSILMAHARPETGHTAVITTASKGHGT